MKEKSVLMKGLVLLLVFSIALISFSLADENNETVNETNAQINNETSNQTQQQATTQDTEQDLTDLERGFQCLADRLGDSCSGASTVQELAFSILASPDGLIGACVNRLEEKKISGENCFGDGSSCGIKETAWAIMALDHVRKDTSSYVAWLKNQNKTSTDVNWFLQQDSEEAAECRLTYDGNDYSFSSRENKKLQGNPGPCFSFARSDFWLRLNSECLDKQFQMVCNRNYFAGWHYEVPGSNIMNVLADTARRSANDPVTLNVNSKCFGSGSCNFEDTAWATIALKIQGEEIIYYIPYLVSAEESNLRYFPAALNYLVMEWSEVYGNKVIRQQRNNEHWEAESSVYGRYYDTALALMSFPKTSSQEQIVNARNWLVNFAQDANGCWNSNSVRDTALVLWALERRPSTSDSQIEIDPVTMCSEGGFFCTGVSTCQGVGGSILNNYYCSSSFEQCCDTNPIKSCSEHQGEVCSGDLVCSGSAVESTEGMCCLTECVERQQPVTACEQASYQCRDVCLSTQEESSLSCTGGQVCCAPLSAPQRSGIPLWVWLLLGIIIILIVLAVIFRDRLKAYYYKYTKKKDSDKTSNQNQQGPPRGPPGPPRPGFPPMRRPIGRPLPTQGMNRPMPPRPPQRPPQNQNNTFAKLKEMTK